MKQIFHTAFSRLLTGLLVFSLAQTAAAQSLNIPQGSNFPSSISRSVGVTDIHIAWNAPGVKGREGKIWGTVVAPYGFTVLGFGSNVESPWRAGADENTVISFSTDVAINGKPLSAGKYGFHIALYADSCVLIFNKNTGGWGSYFYRKDLDVLRVKTVQRKNQPTMQERLAFNFHNQTNESVEVALEWERWQIPFTVTIDAKATMLASIQKQMSGQLGFDAPSLTQAANWCVNNNVYLDGALVWINNALNPNLGGTPTFGALSVKSQLLGKQGKTAEAAAALNMAIDNGTAPELHGYGRQLLAEKKPKEALAIFQKNYERQKGAWPTNVGMTRGYNGVGDLKSALKHAKLALEQAPDDLNKNSLKRMIELLEQGKPLE